MSPERQRSHAHASHIANTGHTLRGSRAEDMEQQVASSEQSFSIRNFIWRTALTICAILVLICIWHSPYTSRTTSLICDLIPAACNYETSPWSLYDSIPRLNWCKLCLGRSNYESRLSAVEAKVRHTVLQDKGEDLVEDAVIIPEFTNAHEKGRHSLSSWFSSRVVGFDIRDIQAGTKDPNLALRKGIDTRLCWNVDAPSALLGFRLPRPANITTITIDDIHSDLLATVNTAKSPRDIMIWALWEGPAPTAHFPLQLRHPTAFTFMTGKKRLPASIQHKHYFVLISKGQYQIGGPPRQHFFVNAEVLEIVTLFQTIVVEVQSNWGSQTCTRLCHVGVYESFNEN